jgi:hypothetical protein
MIEPVLLTIMAGGVDVRHLLAKKKQCKFSAARFRADNQECADALDIILDYVSHWKRMPAAVEVLREWVNSLPMSEQLDADTRQWYTRHTSSYRLAIDKLEELMDGDTFKPSSDFDLVCQAMLDDARKLLHVNILLKGIDIIQGTYNPPTKGAPMLGGIKDAQMYIAKKRSLDVCADEGQLVGDLHENLDTIERMMLDHLETSARNRCLTGFPEIDGKIAIGPGQEFRLIGIAGYSNHGKSGMLMTMMYNMLREGKRILFIPLEFSAFEAWCRLVWLHMEERNDLNVPSLQFWKLHPREVTDQHKANFHTLVEDLRSGTTLPGRIEVQQVRTWAEVEELANSAVVPYDAIVVDYFGHMSYEGHDRREGIGKIFKQAQAFAHAYKEKRGRGVHTLADQ